MSNTAVVPASQAIRVYNREEQDLLKETVAQGLTDPEFKLFVQVCKHTGLDPFAKQIYAIKRWDGRAQREVMGIQTSIDGFRLIAERTGKYAGQDAPQWCGADLVWREVWLDPAPPAAAKVTVKKVVDGNVVETTAIARFSSYVQTKKDGTPNAMWATMPDGQIAKCAESLALRKAFPQELSGLHTADEGNLSDEFEPPEPPHTTLRHPPGTDPPAPDDDSQVVDGEIVDDDLLEVERATAAIYTAKELTAELQLHDLDTSGTKAERVERLAQFMATHPEAGTTEPAGEDASVAADPDPQRSF